MRFGETARLCAEAVSPRRLGKQVGGGRGESGASAAIANGGAVAKPVKPSAPSGVVTTALPLASASSTFIRMPPPLRTGAITTAAVAR